jgi:excisionase family DNA binding protein
MKLAMTIDEAAKQGPLGKTSIYAAIGKGDLPARKLGGRTFIMADDFRAWLESQPRIQPKAA